MSMSKHKDQLAGGLALVVAVIVVLLVVGTLFLVFWR